MKLKIPVTDKQLQRTSEALINDIHASREYTEETLTGIGEEETLQEDKLGRWALLCQASTRRRRRRRTRSPGALGPDCFSYRVASMIQIVVGGCAKETFDGRQRGGAAAEAAARPPLAGLLSLPGSCLQANGAAHHARGWRRQAACQAASSPTCASRAALKQRRRPPVMVCRMRSSVVMPSVRFDVLGELNTRFDVKPLNG